MPGNKGCQQPRKGGQLINPKSQTLLGFIYVTNNPKR